jgi:predicted N-formylglutamate amidohydrolase
MRMPDARLLARDEPAPVSVAREAGASPFVLVCDHAGRAVPRALNDLGLPDAERARHIGWDIGAAGVTEALGAALDAATLMQRYSRLVIDCNRPLGHATSIPEVSDGTRVPANAALSAEARTAREVALFHPYQDAIGLLLARRAASGQRSVLVAIHSFTPVFQGVTRKMHAGMLFGRDARLGHALGASLREDTALAVADNEPYALDYDTDYTVPVHGEARGLPCVEIEIRQDLIAEASGQVAWARRLAHHLPRALAALGPLVDK